jgi:hypothetical protein
MKPDPGSKEDVAGPEQHPAHLDCILWHNDIIPLWVAHGEVIAFLLHILPPGGPLGLWQGKGTASEGSVLSAHFYVAHSLTALLSQSPNPVLLEACDNEHSSASKGNVPGATKTHMQLCQVLIVEHAVDHAQGWLDVSAHLDIQSRACELGKQACRMNIFACTLDTAYTVAQHNCTRPRALTGTCAVLFFEISAASMSMWMMRARCANASSLPVTRSSNLQAQVD